MAIIIYSCMEHSENLNQAKRIGPSYTERLEHYFEANDVNSAEKQRAILLSGCGASTYQRFGSPCKAYHQVVQRTSQTREGPSNLHSTYTSV